MERGNKNVLANWALSAVCLYLLDLIFKGISFSGLTSILITAVVFGLVNALIKPVVSILSLPLTIITLGFFSLVINALMLSFTAFLVPGFSISSFGTAFFAAIVLSLLNLVFIDKKDK